MRFTQPTTEPQTLPFTPLKIQGCTNLTIGFDLLEEEPEVSRRRYCNKILVHECVSVPAVSPMELDYVELLATEDPCYSVFRLYKTSREDVEDVSPTIQLQLNDDNLVIGILVEFSEDETCGQPLRMAYKLYGYVDDTRILLSNGNLYITPCRCSDEGPTTWENLSW